MERMTEVNPQTGRTSKDTPGLRRARILVQAEAGWDAFRRVVPSSIHRGQAHRDGRGTPVGLTILSIVQRHPTTGCGSAAILPCFAAFMHGARTL
jgi:hypothetical protein